LVCRNLLDIVTKLGLFIDMVTFRVNRIPWKGLVTDIDKNLKSQFLSVTLLYYNTNKMMTFLLIDAFIKRKFNNLRFQNVKVLLVY